MGWNLLMVGCPADLLAEMKQLSIGPLIGFTVLRAIREDALESKLENADLIVLHENGADGAIANACERLRAITTVPLLTIVNRYDDDEMAASFAAGANDFIYPPYTPRELLARIRAHLRRSHEYSVQQEKSEQYQFPGLAIDVSRHEVFVNGLPVRLTPKEFGLLRLLAAHAGKAVSRDQLLHDVWGRDNHNTRTLDVHIGRLRQKIETNPSEPKFIITVAGHGYKLNV